MNRILVLAIATTAAAIGWGVGPAALAEGGQSVVLATDAPAESPRSQFASAQGAATFPLIALAPDLGGRVAGLSTVHASDDGDTGSELGFDQFSVAASGQRVHLWQTASASLASSGKDPTVGGAPVLIGSATWQYKSVDRPGGVLNILSTRTSAGTTLSLDSTLHKTALIEIAGRLAV